MLTQDEIDDWYFDPPIPPNDVKSPDPKKYPYYHGWGEIDGIRGPIWSDTPWGPRFAKR